MARTTPPGVSRGAYAVAHNLRVDDTTAGVLGAFERAAVPCILLKGPSLVRWLYPGHARVYSDSDLLVAPAAIDAAEEVLRGLGYVPEVDRRRMPAWWQEHAVEWRREPHAPTVDLHRTLVGVGIDEDRLWTILWAGTETLTVGGFPARVLGVPARAVHLCLHAAQNGSDRGDLSLAIASAGEDVWLAAASLAEELDATAAFAAGLRILPAGRLLAARLGLPSAANVEVALRAGGAPAQALTIHRMALASGPRERLAILRHKVAPPPTFMRAWSPLARRGGLGLALAYAQRAAWLARSAPPALRAWARTRRAIGDQTGGGA